LAANGRVFTQGRPTPKLPSKNSTSPARSIALHKSRTTVLFEKHPMNFSLRVPPFFRVSRATAPLALLALLPLLEGTTRHSASAAETEKPTSAAYIVVDHQSGHVLSEWNADKKLQVASLTKIVTATVVLDWVHATEQTLDQYATVPPFPNELLVPNGVAWKDGDKATLRDLLYAALLQSDNVAAQTLAEFVGQALSGGSDRELHNISFVAQMNAFARKRGMLNTRFLNAHGLETLEGKRPYSTVEDMAKATIYAMSNPNFLFFVAQKERTIGVQHFDGGRMDYKLVNTNRLLGTASIDGVKTGTTKRAGECLIISAARPPEVHKDGDTFYAIPRRLEVVLLGSQDRFGEAKLLLEKGWKEHESWVAAGRPETPRPERKKSLFGF
jgi:D-alanyl-D-alanine carboxypeptidase (penicillin-binding protein 5/6)